MRKSHKEKEHTHRVGRPIKFSTLIIKNNKKDEGNLKLKKLDPFLVHSLVFGWRQNHTKVTGIRRTACEAGRQEINR